MKALLVTTGSQGDVRPFTALAVRLRQEGHTAVLAAPASYGHLAAAHGVPFVPLNLDMSQVGAAITGRHGLRHMLAFCRAMGQRAAAILPDLAAAAGGAGRAGPDVIVHHPVLPLGQHLAELRRVPAVVAQPLPALVPTTEFASAAWPIRLPPSLNWASYGPATLLAGAWCRRDVDRWRRVELGLPPRPGRHDPLVSWDSAPVTALHAYSAHVVPRPADWPASAHVTGYWTLPAEPAWSPPHRLAKFTETDGGGPVVYVGFGSMPGPDPERLAAALITAADRTGVRAVVASLSPELRRLLPPSRFHLIRHAPHSWLFPRMRAIVHHGGAGTAAAAILAGRPQVIWPFGVDQAFWARRLARLGVARPARPVTALTGPRLADALGAALGDGHMAGRAAQLSASVQTEDGTGRAIALIEAALRGSRLAVNA
jgi:sterol 3beta-glucosyltransferase